MELASRAAIPEPPIAVIGQLSENSRLGFGLAESALFQVPMPVKYLNGVRDSSSVAWNSWQMSLKAQQQAVSVSNTTYSEKTNADGSVTRTATTTYATFSTEKGKEGTFLGAATYSNSSTTHYDSNGTFVGYSQSSSKPQSIGYGEAVHALGADKMSAGVQSAVGGWASHFAQALGHDIATHPFRAIGRAIAIGALTADPPTSPLGVGLAVGGAAADLGESVQHAREEQ